MKKVHIITYGCTANQADSNIMISQLEKDSHKITDFDTSEYVIVNTCAVKNTTENKIISKLKKLSTTEKKIIVGGCLTGINLERIKKTVPNFSAIMDTRSVHKISSIINKAEDETNITVFSEQAPEKPKYLGFNNGIVGIVQISEGCDLSCSYCATTIARGDLKCFSSNDIVRAASNMVKAGCKEIYLTSQDNGAYNYDSTTLPKLLSEICKIDANFKVRNGMTNPVYMRSILDQLIEIYKNEKMYKFLHIPVQSGSNEVLKAMKRGYTVEYFEEIVAAFRKEIPQINILTDVIVGFPTETEEDFQKTLKLIERVRPDAINLSKFGRRPGTEAMSMKDIPSGILKERCTKAAKICRSMESQKNKEWIGWKGEIFINEVGKNNSYMGRNFAYKLVAVKSDENLLGKMVSVEVVDASTTHMVGQAIMAAQPL